MNVDIYSCFFWGGRGGGYGNFVCHYLVGGYLLSVHGCEARGSALDCKLNGTSQVEWRLILMEPRGHWNDMCFSTKKRGAKECQNPPKII